MKRISRPLAQGLGVAFVALAVLPLAGCDEETDDLPYTTIFEPQAAYDPRPSTGNAYDGYLLAGERAVKACEDFQDRVNYTDGLKEQLRDCAAPALRDLCGAAQNPCTVRFTPHSPSAPRTHQQGLVLLTRAIRFESEAAVEARDWARSVDLLIITTKVASDLSAGDASDASLGYTLADAAREPIAPSLPEMPVEELERLAVGIDKILQRKAPITESIQKEAENFRAGIQLVQDAHQSNDYKEIEETMYKSVQPAVKYLKGLSGQERVEYFQGFLAEAEKTVAHYSAEAQKPSSERTKLKHDSRAHRPWKRFASQLFGTLEPLLSLNDAFIAKSRLLAVSSLATARAKETGETPLDFKVLSPETSIDPYSGRPFPYRAAGKEFRVYSVGEDGRDDGGINDTITGLDLLLTNDAD